MYKIQFILITLFFILFLSGKASAELAYIDPATHLSVLDQVTSMFAGKVKSWQNIIQSAAERLFWTLVLISMVWTFGMMLLRKADIGDFFCRIHTFYYLYRVLLLATDQRRIRPQYCGYHYSLDATIR